MLSKKLWQTPADWGKVILIVLNCVELFTFFSVTLTTNYAKYTVLLLNILLILTSVAGLTIFIAVFLKEVSKKFHLIKAIIITATSLRASVIVIILWAYLKPEEKLFVTQDTTLALV